MQANEKSKKNDENKNFMIDILLEDMELEGFDFEGMRKATNEEEN